jgi:hypothetical protein
MQRFLCLLVSLFLLAAFAPAAAFAQIGNINDLAAKNSLEAQDIARIEKFVADQSAKLSSKDPQEVKAARDALLRVLQERTVTLAFRGEYAKNLIALLEQLLKNPGVDLHAANALRIAGELATRSIVDPLLLAGLKDSRSSVRYAAAFAIARMFETIGLHSPAIDPAKLKEVVRAVAELIKTEPDALVLDGLVLAMRAALRVPPDAVRSDSNFVWSTVSVLAEAATTRSTGLAKEQKPAQVVPVLLRITLAIRETVTGANLAVPQAQKGAIFKFCTDGAAAAKALRNAPPPADAQAADIEKMRADLTKLEEALNSLSDLLGGKSAPAGPGNPGGRPGGNAPGGG